MFFRFKERGSNVTRRHRGGDDVGFRKVDEKWEGCCRRWSKKTIRKRTDVETGNIIGTLSQTCNCPLVCQYSHLYLLSYLTYAYSLSLSLSHTHTLSFSLVSLSVTHSHSHCLYFSLTHSLTQTHTYINFPHPFFSLSHTLKPIKPSKLTHSVNNIRNNIVICNF